MQIKLGRLQSSALLLLLYSAALVVRTPGLDWGGIGLDENPGAAGKLLAGEWGLAQSYYPPLLSYLTALAYGLYYAIGRLLGWWSSTQEFRAFYFTDKMQFYVIARVVVTAISATAAPLAYLIAFQQGIRPRYAVAIGLILALLPSSVFFSHVAKSDNGLGPAYLLLFFTSFRFYESPEIKTRQLSLAASIAIALSFKHSAVFIIFPVLAIVCCSMLPAKPISVTVKSLLTTAIMTIVVWIPLNFGILIDLRSFLDAQIVQSQMSYRESEIVTTLSIWLRLITSEDGGVSPITFALWLCTPIAILVVRNAKARFKIGTMWLSVVVAVAIVLSIVGNRQTTWLMLPYAVIIGTTVLLAAVQLTSASSRYALIPVTVLVLTGAVSSVGTAEVIRQAIAPPISREISATLERLFPTKVSILTSVILTRYLPVSSEGLHEERLRDEILAKKYSVALPAFADESQRVITEGYKVRGFPFVIGGLESIAPENIKIILPFAWPIQSEEWHLQYWLDRNYRVFIVERPLLDHPLAAYRNFFRSIDQQCNRLATVISQKPMFYETDTSIYQCA